MTPISDTVQAALHYVNPKGLHLKDWEFACDTMYKQRSHEDPKNVCPMMSAAARILADEVVRLRGEQPRIIARSKCCQALAVVEGMPGSTKWYACSHCNKPCDVYHQENTTQPQ
jgi:hypothetical protein